jgi:hypothetical protein
MVVTTASLDEFELLNDEAGTAVAVEASFTGQWGWTRYY